MQVIPTKKFRGFGMAKYLKDHMNVDWEEEEENKMQKLFNHLNVIMRTLYFGETYPLCILKVNIS